MAPTTPAVSPTLQMGQLSTQLFSSRRHSSPSGTGWGHSQTGPHLRWWQEPQKLGLGGLSHPYGHRPGLGPAISSLSSHIWRGTALRAENLPGLLMVPPVWGTDFYTDPSKPLTHGHLFPGGKFPDIPGQGLTRCEHISQTPGPPPIPGARKPHGVWNLPGQQKVQGPSVERFDHSIMNNLEHLSRKTIQLFSIGDLKSQSLCPVPAEPYHFPNNAHPAVIRTPNGGTQPPSNRFPNFPIHHYIFSSDQGNSHSEW